ncbi:MAG: hypothetical protein CM15mP12_7330 [Gammaproteobacteria bacterium]|nr:MAG: hypothetical protein CM15mP12_7330 [Gammaproteobacteria bacterium]
MHLPAADINAINFLRTLSETNIFDILSAPNVDIGPCPEIKVMSLPSGHNFFSD